MCLFLLPFANTAWAVPFAFRFCSEVDAGEVKPLNGTLETRENNSVPRLGGPDTFGIRFYVGTMYQCQ